MSDGQRCWSVHLNRIAAEGVTTKAYAERERLSVAALYYWSSRLKAEAASAQQRLAKPVTGRCLVPVHIDPSPERYGCTLTLSAAVQLELADELPSRGGPPDKPVAIYSWTRRVRSSHRKSGWATP